MRQVVGIDADAVATHQPWAERQEVPLGAGRLEHLGGVEIEFVEKDRELVDERDVHVPLGVLDDLGRLGDADRGCAVNPCADDPAVQFGHSVRGLGRGSADDLYDVGEAPSAVPGVDSLRGVADREVLVDLQAGRLLKDRDAVLLGAPRIHRGLVDHKVAGFQGVADDPAGGQ